MIGLLLALVPTGGAVVPDWHTDLDEATVIAARDERPLLVVFR